MEDICGYRGETRDGIFKLFSNQGIHSKESIPPAYVACAGKLGGAIGARNRVEMGLPYRPARLHRLAESIPGLLRSLKIPSLAGRCDNPIPTRFLGPHRLLKFQLCIVFFMYFYNTEQCEYKCLMVYFFEKGQSVNSRLRNRMTDQSKYKSSAVQFMVQCLQTFHFFYTYCILWTGFSMDLELQNIHNASFQWGLIQAFQWTPTGLSNECALVNS